MERRKFTWEFKLLGVHQSQLWDWAKKFAEDPERSKPNANLAKAAAYFAKDRREALFHREAPGND